MFDSLHESSGFCIRCQSLHTLHIGKAKGAALKLIKQLDREKRIDFDHPLGETNSRLHTDYLFGKARGKMFGVMVCERPGGSTVTLKAFSGQYNGMWQVRDWAPPLFDLEQWHAVNDDTEKEIKAMGVAIDALGPKSAEGAAMMEKRAEKSRALMKALHQIYILHNFRSEHRSLFEAYNGNNGIPNGTADCCGPKLLNYAALNNLRPIGLAEFYYGRPGKRGNRQHGQFYPSCQDKCAPIMGYLLCGLKTNEM